MDGDLLYSCDSLMASTNRQSDSISENCAACGQQQPHEVTIALVTESDKDKNTAFSREPYRITECRACGETTKTRMNNA